MSDNKYINLVKGEGIEMSDYKFAQSYTTFEQFKSDFFKDREIEILNESVFNNATETTEFDFSYNNVLFHGIFLNIKNSGMNKSNRDKFIKRMQISNRFKSYDDDAPHYVFGSYNTSDKVLYFIVELKEYIKNKSQGDTYSSFWIDYANICFTYEKGYNRSVDQRNNRIIVGIDNMKINEFEDENFIKQILISDKYFERKIRENNELNKRKLFAVNDNTTYNAGIKLKRNSELKKIAFQRENYTCELCGTTSTFENKNGDEYFEGHHLIMYNLSSQIKYKYSLDTSDNIICLCPNCHRKIHYADEKIITDCITKLIEKHKNLFEIYEFDNIDKILENYNNYEKDDDND